MLVYTYGRWPTSCIVGKPSPRQSTTSLGMLDGTSHLARLAKNPYRDNIVIRQLSGLGAHFHVPGSHERGDLPGAGFLDGQAGADVTGVTFELQDHRDVKASLEHGWPHGGPAAKV